MSRSKQSEEVSALKRARLLTVFDGLVREHGLGNVTMDLLAHTADVASGTLYLYYPALSVLVDAWLDRCASPEEQAILRKHFVTREPARAKRPRAGSAELDALAETMRPLVERGWGASVIARQLGVPRSRVQIVLQTRYKRASP